MTLSEAFRKGTGILRAADIDAPAADAGVILCHVAKCDRAYLYAHGDLELDEGLLRDYISILKRRILGYPLQYLTGLQEFMSLTFEVAPGVLIPRQDTELLVETVIHFCKAKGDLRILDIGTGSGCIAISLAHYLPGCTVVAVDKMAGALEIAKRNACLNGVEDRVLFIQSDLFENLKALPSSAKCRLSDEQHALDGHLSNRSFDVIVSNPPYVRSGDIKRLQMEVRNHEPIEALDGGNDGLFFYREIIRIAPGHLADGGMLAFETGYDQADAVATLMSGGTQVSDNKFAEDSPAEKVSLSCFDSIRIHKDLAGIDRVVSGVYRRSCF